MSWRQVDCKILALLLCWRGGAIANAGGKAILIICIILRSGLLCRKEGWILLRRRRG